MGWFLHTRKLPHRWDHRGASGPQRGVPCSETGALKAKQRKFTTEFVPSGTSLTRSGSHAHVCLQ